jgi:hypothetical protein
MILGVHVQFEFKRKLFLAMTAVLLVRFAPVHAKDLIVDKAAPDFKATRSTAENSLWPITRARY